MTLAVIAQYIINKDKSTETITISLAEYNELKSSKEHCSGLEAQVKCLMEQLKINNRKAYGSKSEQSEYVYEQLSLLHNEAEFYSDIEAKEEVKVVSHTRKKKTATLEKLPENIKTVVVEHTLLEEEHVCPNCNERLEIIGKEVKQILKIKPAEVYVQEDIYYTYACKNCEKNDIETPVIKAPQKKTVIKGSSLQQRQSPT